MSLRRKRERGAAAVEFALILPLFLILIFGMVQFGFYFWTAETANSSAREVARRMAVGDCWDATERDAFARSHAPRMVGSATVSPSVTGLTAGDEFEVTVKADGNLIGLLPLPEIDGVSGRISRQYVARLEYEVDSGSCPS